MDSLPKTQSGTGLYGLRGCQQQLHHCLQLRQATITLTLLDLSVFLTNLGFEQLTAQLSSVSNHLIWVSV